MGVVTYRAATLDDAGLIASWHDDPEVNRFWDGETFTAAEMRERLARPDVDAWIVEEDHEPVGYLQSWWEEGEPRRGGLDGFLVPSARGRGVMPTAAAICETIEAIPPWKLTPTTFSLGLAAVFGSGRAVGSSTRTIVI